MDPVYGMVRHPMSSRDSGVTISNAKQSHEAIVGWTKLFDSVREADLKELERWKDEMDNILVFVSFISPLPGTQMSTYFF